MKTKEEVTAMLDRLESIIDRVRVFSERENKDIHPARYLQALKMITQVGDYIPVLCWITGEYRGKPLEDQLDVAPDGEYFTLDKFATECEKFVSLMYSEDKAAREYRAGNSHPTMSKSKDVRNR